MVQLLVLSIVGQLELRVDSHDIMLTVILIDWKDVATAYKRLMVYLPIPLSFTGCCTMQVVGCLAIQSKFLGQ